MTRRLMIRGCWVALALSPHLGKQAAAAFAATADKSQQASPRVVWQGPEVNTLGAPSRDGRWISYVDPSSGDLAVRDLRAGERRFVTRKDPSSQQGEFAYFSVISRDGKRVALAWFNEDHFYDLRLAEIPAAGEQPQPPRVLYRNREAGFVQPCAFSPDGKYVLTLFFRRDNISQIALVSVADGSTRTLKSLNWVYPKRMDFSPDGRWIVYDNLSADKAEERDIFVLAADGSRETRLPGGAANDLFPLWSPDGGEVLFLSDRSGSSGIWAAPVQDGEPAGEPRLLQDGLGRPLPLGITSAGDLYYGLRAGTTDVYTAELGSPLPATPAIHDTPGRNFGAVFSPDGSTLAYLSLRGTENYGLDRRVVLLYSLQQKQSRELPVHMAHVERVAWSPDGRRLLLSGSDRRARGGLFEYELESGRTEAVVLGNNTGYEGLQGTYAATGSDVIYARPGSPPAFVALNLADRSERVLYESPPDVTLAYPVVSPDGKRLAFAILAPGDRGTGDILLLDLPTNNAHKLLTLPSGRLTDLTWMPGGGALLVGTEGSSGARLWRVSAAGDSMEPVIEASQRQPVVSVHPDGRRVALTIGETHDEIWVLEHAASPTSAAQP
jgi:Tol biopolymer transport system component